MTHQTQSTKARYHSWIIQNYNNRIIALCKEMWINYFCWVCRIHPFSYLPANWSNLVHLEEFRQKKIYGVMKSVSNKLQSSLITYMSNSDANIHWIAHAILSHIFIFTNFGNSLCLALFCFHHSSTSPESHSTPYDRHHSIQRQHIWFSEQNVYWKNLSRNDTTMNHAFASRSTTTNCPSNKENRETNILFSVRLYKVIGTSAVTQRQTYSVFSFFL